MSGLKVVDDKTFTITTAQSRCRTSRSDSATLRSPHCRTSFFEDPKAFEEKPIGAGPFQLETKSNTEFVLTKFADFSGANKANVDKLTFRDLPGSGSRLRGRRGRQPRLHRRQQHPAGPVHR